MTIAAQDKSQSQLDKFKEAARELETDDDEARFDERLKRIVKHRPVDKAPPDETPSVNSLWDAADKVDDGALPAIN
jgi:hypothetical protein